MKELLGLSTKGNFATGQCKTSTGPKAIWILSMLHWSTLCAQWKAMIQLEHSNFDDIVGKENLNLIFQWLDKNLEKREYKITKN